MDIHLINNTKSSTINDILIKFEINFNKGSLFKYGRVFKCIYLQISSKVYHRFLAMIRLMKREILNYKLYFIFYVQHMRIHDIEAS